MRRITSERELRRQLLYRFNVGEKVRFADVLIQRNDYCMLTVHDLRTDTKKHFGTYSSCLRKERFGGWIYEKAVYKALKHISEISEANTHAA